MSSNARKPRVSDLTHRDGLGFRTFTAPTHGNTQREPPVNSVRNLQRWLNRQARDAKS